MASEQWRPLSQREGRADPNNFSVSNEGVPLWLRDSLVEWVRARCSRYLGSNWYLDRDVVRMLERRLRESLWDGGSRVEGWEKIESRLKRESDFLLDVLDAISAAIDPENADELDHLVALQRILVDGGSAYWLSSVGEERYGLVRRVEEAAEHAAEQVLSDTDRAAMLLRRAWTAAYGRQPDPSDAYRSAVRAVEAVATAVVTPADRKATLGRVIGQLRATQGQWRFELSHRDEPELPMATVVGMMDTLWGSQHDRHVEPDENAPLHVSQEEAEAAVHLAVTLVHYFRVGAIKKRP